MTPPVNAAQIYMELFPELPGEDHPAKEYPIVFAICGLIAETRTNRLASDDRQGAFVQQMNQIGETAKTLMGTPRNEPNEPQCGMLEYLLRELQTAARIMHRDKSDFHVFDYGTTPEGTKYVVAISILPEAAIAAYPLKPSNPVQEPPIQ